MSNRRFPRTKFVRQLVRMEDELQSWSDTYECDASFPRPRDEVEALSCRANELRVVARRLHQLADDMAGMPIRMRDLLERAKDPSRG